MGKNRKNRRNHSQVLPQTKQYEGKPLPEKTDRVHLIRQVSETFSGPLPHPDILQRYNEILPGSAERIFKTFEGQTQHRQKLERSVVKTDNAKSIMGLVFGFVIAITAICGGIYCALEGRPFLGGTLSFTGIALIVASFIYKKKSEETDPQTKDKI